METEQSADSLVLGSRGRASLRLWTLTPSLLLKHLRSSLLLPSLSARALDRSVFLACRGCLALCARAPLFPAVVRNACRFVAAMSRAEKLRQLAQLASPGRPYSARDGSLTHGASTCAVFFTHAL